MVKNQSGVDFIYGVESNFGTDLPSLEAFGFSSAYSRSPPHNINVSIDINLSISNSNSKQLKKRIYLYILSN